jgi:hypothetical protein
MEQNEQINDNFNAEKTNKKKGLIVGAILITLLIVVALLAYFFMFNNPKFIFSKAIDKIFTVNTKTYDSMKFDSTIKATVETDDYSLKDYTSIFEKVTLRVGTQLDVKNKQEIVDLGIKYDNQAVADAQIYYNNGEMYAYLEGLFDKYIELDMDEESRAQMDEIFKMATAEEEIETAEKVLKTIKDEFKMQLKEKGEFEKEKATITVGNNEEKVAKISVKLTQEQLYDIISSMCTELAKNDKFINSIEGLDKETLIEVSEKIGKLQKNDENYIKINLYTKGLLNNKLVKADVEIYSTDEDSTAILSIIKENKEVYSYKVSVKSSILKVDLVKGKVEIKKDKDSKKEQSGKIIVTAEVTDLGNAKLEIDYSTKVNSGIDKIDVSNSVKPNELTAADVQGIVAELMKRPVIGEVLQNAMMSQSQNVMN